MNDLIIKEIVILFKTLEVIIHTRLEDMQSIGAGGEQQFIIEGVVLQFLDVL